MAPALLGGFDKQTSWEDLASTKKKTKTTWKIECIPTPFVPHNLSQECEASNVILQAGVTSVALVGRVIQTTLAE